jgi:hypothetical protein
MKLAMKIFTFIICAFEVSYCLAQSATPPKLKYASTANVDLRKIGYLFLADSISADDNEITFACMDSIFSSDKGTRDYFFPVFEKIATQADGSLAEIIGPYTLAYIKKYPQEFLDRYRCCQKDDPCCQKLVVLATFLGEETMMDDDKAKVYHELMDALKVSHKNQKNENALALLIRTVDATRKHSKD